MVFRPLFYKYLLDLKKSTHFGCRAIYLKLINVLKIYAIDFIQNIFKIPMSWGDMEITKHAKN